MAWNLLSLFDLQSENSSSTIPSTTESSTSDGSIEEDEVSSVTFLETDMKETIPNIVSFSKVLVVNLRGVEFLHG